MSLQSTDVGTHDGSASGPLSHASFDATHWSVVTDAGDRLSPKSGAALETLCRAYWHPIYAYIRRKGLSPADAEDVTQEFFCQLIGRNSLESVDRSRGSFRSFLLASVNHLLANGWDKARALKRGGGRAILSLDAEEAEGRFAQESAVHDSPEQAFDRRWAVTLLDRALAIVREEFIASGKLPQFDLLKRFLSEVPADGEYLELADRLGLEPGRVSLVVHRLRLRYREVVRAEIAQTVANDDELKCEMRHLFAALG